MTVLGYRPAEAEGWQSLHRTIGWGLKACGRPRGTISVLLSILLAGCVTQSGEGMNSAGAERQSGSTFAVAENIQQDGRYAVPPNYRQLVAQKMTESAGRNPIRSATISQPTEWFAGIFEGGTRLTVCATMIQDGGERPNHWYFLFEHGQISSAIARRGATWCSNIPEAPLPEAAKRR
jgi:hypothetical protein